MKQCWRTALRKVRIDDRLVPILIAVVLAIVIALFLWSQSSWYRESSSEIWRGIYIEATGAVMDILLVSSILALSVVWANLNLERSKDIIRQKELIDDFKRWNSDEAHHRMAGALRRLNRLRCTEIDLSGLVLSDFSFTWHEIKSIEGSIFYDGSWGTQSRKDNVTLERVDFATVNCRNVVFSRFNPFLDLGLRLRFATFKDCNFRNAQLQGAIFRGAHLEWSKEPPQEMGDWIDTEDGDKVFRQTYWPPFHDADLTGASFREVLFKNADFRDALNIQLCSFAGAEGLETCLFDDEEEKKRILEAAESNSD